MVLKEFKRRGVGDVCCCDCRKRAEAEGSVLIHLCITKKRDICIAAFHDYFDAYVVANVVHKIPIGINIYQPLICLYIDESLCGKKSIGFPAAVLLGAHVILFYLSFGVFLPLFTDPANLTGK